MLLIGVWLIAHCLGFAILYGRRNRVFFAVACLLLVFLFYNKPLTFDLGFYSKYFDTLDQRIFGFSVEPGFYWINYLLVKVLFLEPGVITLFWQMMILALCTVAISRVVSQAVWYEIAIFVLLSLYYLLTAHNGIRQGLALCLVFFGFSLFATGSRMWGVAYCAAALLFHRYAALFVLVVLVFVFLSWAAGRYSRCSPAVTLTAALVFGSLLSAYAMAYGGVYGDTSVNWGGYRSSTFVKAGAIGLLYLLTERLMKTEILNESMVLIVRLRRFVFCFMLPLVFAGEIFSRVAIFYFLVEAALMVVLLSSRQKNNMAAGAFIMLAYGCAPNAWNIISAEPRQWLGFLQL